MCKVGIKRHFFQGKECGKKLTGAVLLVITSEIIFVSLIRTGLTGKIPGKLLLVITTCRVGSGRGPLLGKKNKEN